MKKHRRLRCYQMKCWNAWCWDKMLKCLMLRRLRSKVRLRSQTTKLASDLIADIKMTLNGHDYTDIQKKPFVAISLGPGKRGGRWFVEMKRTASVTPIFDWTLKRTFSTWRELSDEFGTHVLDACFIVSSLQYTNRRRAVNKSHVKCIHGVLTAGNKKT